MMLRAAILWVLSAFAVQAATCETLTYKDASYTVCDTTPTTDALRLFLNDADGEPFGYFSAVNEMLEAEGETLSFAMNAGMYHDNRAPVGHYVENGTEMMRVIPNAGPGNFGLLPNGVFCIREDRADVIETLRFVKDAPACRFASQSGPMLVIDGEVHPRFLPDGTSRYVRNGVGTTADGSRAVFVISNGLVNFHAFASFFRDHLKLPQALFFDGNVSRLYAPDIGRRDLGRRLGPIVGVVVPAN